VVFKFLNPGWFRSDGDHFLSGGLQGGQAQIPAILNLHLKTAGDTKTVDRGRNKGEHDRLADLAELPAHPGQNRFLSHGGIPTISHGSKMMKTIPMFELLVPVSKE
jgi:hypothetical protein